MNEWPLQDAKNKFSAVVDAAAAGDPQRVTRRGKPVVVVFAVEEYERLCRLEKAKAPTFADLLLAIPQDDEEFEPTSIALSPGRFLMSTRYPIRQIITAFRDFPALVGQRRTLTDAAYGSLVDK